MPAGLALGAVAFGVGSILRFPRQAVLHGGWTFMVPYLVALVLLGLPMLWIEFGLGRRGGLAGHGSLPGMLDAAWKRPIAKYVGVAGLFLPVAVLVYYCCIVSWTLAWSLYAIAGQFAGRNPDSMRSFLQTYQDVQDGGVGHAALVPYLFFAVTLAAIVWLACRERTPWMDRLSRFALPLLFVLAVPLLVRVFTLDGLTSMGAPDWTALAEPGIWLAATGQVFFTLSVGFGVLPALASQLGKGDDIAWKGLARGGQGGTADVMLGGALAIPAAMTFLGAGTAMAVAAGGGFDLGLVAMPMLFSRLPGGDIVGMMAGFAWFGLLFVAGVASAVIMATPMLSFLDERFGWNRRQSGMALGVLLAMLGVVHILLYTKGFLDEWDFWAGTLGLVVLALVEAVIFVWVMTPGRAWAEVNEGATARIPGLFRFVITYITPVLLAAILGWWAVQDAWPTLTMVGRPPEEVAVRWFSRGVLVAILVAQLFLIRMAWIRRRPGRRHTEAY